MRTVAFCVAVSLVGCATGYHSRSFTGGFTDMRLDAQTFQVSYRGNAYTARETVQQYGFYRCAELTLQNGFDYFVILDSSGSVSQGYYTTPGTYSSRTTASATAYGNTAYGTSQTYGSYTPGATIPITKHGSSVVIRAFRGQRPPDVQGAFDAREVLTYMGPSVDPQGAAALLQWANASRPAAAPAGGAPQPAPQPAQYAPPTPGPSAR